MKTHRIKIIATLHSNNPAHWLLYEIQNLNSLYNTPEGENIQLSNGHNLYDTIENLLSVFYNICGIDANHLDFDSDEFEWPLSIDLSTHFPNP